MRKKLKDTGGLTMVEMLCAVAILVLLCLMMNTGIGMAVKSYRDITAESETQLLVSTLSDALADKLRYCVVTEKPGAGSDPTTYPLSIGEIIVSDGTDACKDAAGAVIPAGIVIARKTETDASGAAITTNQRLLPDSAYGDPNGGAYIGRYTVEQAAEKDADGNDVFAPLTAYDPDNNVFTVRFAVKDEKTGITQTAAFTVRCLNPLKEETP